MAKKTYLDFSLFDEIGDAMDLFGNLIRNSFEYDAFAGKDEFPAIVITPPVPMDVSQIAAFLPKSDDEESEDKIPKFTFKARIIGPNSPHQFLPDPCDQQVLKDLKQQQNAQDIFDMHTTVIAIGATEKPSLGDIVTIKLDGGTFSYNLQTATFVRLVTSEDQVIKNLLGSQKNECKVGLSSLFASGFMGQSVGPDSSKVRTSFPNICNYVTDYTATAGSVGISKEIMAAFVAVESNGNNLAVRFEPHLFNGSQVETRGDANRAMPYTPNGSGFSSVASETNKAAFEAAFRLNKKRAIEATSFGSVQVLGSHLLSLYKGDPDEAKDAFFNQKSSDSAISKKLVISWFKENNRAVIAANDGDFAELARLYNGTSYAENAYDVNIKNASDKAKKCNSGATSA
jgi:hypothetical protein|tara:strand:+ start:10826 stop:12025 length:1200 start_codon:yes stop_codon:yes gene_type:complete